jgi:phospholipid/cholesterol/gamma-HCH transport system permease protein
MSRFPTINKLLEKTAEQGYFFSSFVRNIFKGSFEFNEFTRQCFVIGYKSLGIVALTGFIVGFVFTLQSLPTLKTFGAQSFAPGMICSGKIASSIGAELGSMNVTEQIDAMEVSGANPVKYLVVTRILACTLMIPLLTLFADAFSIAGGFIGINTSAKMSLDLYLTKSFETLYFSDLFPAMVKSTFLQRLHIK